MGAFAKKAFFQSLGLILFVLLGGLMFRAVEKTNDNAKEEKENMLRSLETRMKSKYNISAQEFNEFAKTAYNAQTPTREWTLEQSVCFAVSIVTTIGYGVHTPSTPLGQVLVIFYALLGIPLALLTLNSMGRLISHGSKRLICAFHKRVLQKPEPRQLEVKTSAVTCLLTFIILLTGSGIAIKATDWTFLEAFYFWFVTFTTIGFGDYVLSEAIRDKPATAQTMKALIAPLFFLMTLFGLAVVASLINSLVDVADKRSCGLRICPCSPRIDDSQEQGRENQPSPTQGQLDVGKTAKRSVQTSTADVEAISMRSLYT